MADPITHLCGLCGPGTYDGQVELVPPPAMSRADGRGICVDVCLALEITRLWRTGVITIECCCGHGRAQPYIAVVGQSVETMRALGYLNVENPHSPLAENFFAPRPV